MSPAPRTFASEITPHRMSARAPRQGGSPRGWLLAVLTAVISACTAAGPTEQRSSRPYDYVAAVEQICRQYAAAQRSLSSETMFAQCMFARGYLVPGFSPSPDSPGYQGGLPGPATHAGGGP
jgi:hypothetical protein